MKEKKNFTERLHSLAYGVIRVTGAGIFLALTVFSMLYSQYMKPFQGEVPINQKDALAQHVLFVALMGLLVWLLNSMDNKLPQKGKKWIERGLLLGAMLWIGGWGFWWINSVDRVPTGDQAFVYGGASYFLEKDYIFLGPGGYCEMYPHQLGLIAFTELFFMLVGAYNYYAFEILCVAMAVGIVLMSYLLMKELKTTFGMRVLFLILIANCIPLICYTSWVYGDIPSIFLAVTAAYCIARYHERAKWYHLAAMILCLTVAMLVRKNSMVLLTALCLLTIVYFLRRHDLRVGIAVLLTILISWLSYQGIYKMYEVKSGYPHCAGLPVNSWIAMGLQDNNGICGWYNNMPKEVLYALDYDYAATEDAMTREIGERLRVFLQNPSYGAKFFVRKVLSQWNAPFFQSIYFSTEYTGNDSPKEGGFLAGVYGFGIEFFRLLAVADKVQFLVYLGMLLYFLLAVKKENHAFQYLLAVNIIGGFFFSILWEAKARYMFPYYVTMFPLAAIGYFRFAELVGLVFLKKKRYNSGV